MRTSSTFATALLAVCLIGSTFSSQAQNEKSAPPRSHTNWHLIRSTTADDTDLAIAEMAKIKDPATFSFLTSGRRTIYAADFALIWQSSLSELQAKDAPKRADSINEREWILAYAKWVRQNLRFGISAEGKIASNEAQAEDAWRLKTSLYIYGGTFNKITNSLTSLSIGFESDRDFKTKKFLVDASTTPTIPSWKIDDIPDSPRAGEFRWRPYFGLTFGDTISQGTSSETTDTVLRLKMRIKAQLILSKGATPPFLFLDNKVVYLPLQDWETHNLFIAGFTIPLSSIVSVGLTYKVGEDSPTFNHLQTFGGQIGIRF